MSTRPPVPSEHDEQVAVVEFLDLLHVRRIAIPNGARVRPSQARKLKAEGMSKGAPDLLLPTELIAIEMKRRDASPSDTKPEQAEWLEALKAAGWRVTVARGAGEAIAWLQAHGYGRRVR